MKQLAWTAVGLGALIGCAQPRSTAENAPRAFARDFDLLSGPAWSGTLTYRDYSSGKPVTIRSTLQVEPESTGVWRIAIGYSDEPNANSRGVWRLVDDGAALSDDDTVQPVISRRIRDGRVEIVTESLGKDNDLPATLRHTYTLAPAQCALRKDVRPQGAAEFIFRNEYRWSR